MSLIVLKVGGASARQAAEHVHDFLANCHHVCVVHGAGPQISAEMVRRGLPVEFVDGRRVTSADGLAVVRKSLLHVNNELCRWIGPVAVGLMGDEIGLRATRLPALGLVGNPVPFAPPVLDAALRERRVPVVSPLAAGPLNVNADEMAAALAVALGADRLWFLTDVPGLLRRGAVVPTIDAAEAERLLAGTELQDGIVPKLEAAVIAAKVGVKAEIGATAVTA
jgi:acetylglutamate kinase